MNGLTQKIYECFPEKFEEHEEFLKVALKAYNDKRFIDMFPSDKVEEENKANSEK